MSFIEEIKERAKKNIKTIVLPESMDIRVLKAASICQKENIAKIILIGKEDEINTLSSKENIDLTNIEIINPFTSNLTNKLMIYMNYVKKKV